MPEGDRPIDEPVVTTEVARAQRIIEGQNLEIRRTLADNGIRHLELEFLTDWFLDGERRQASDRLRRVLLESAEALGARHVKVGDFFDSPVGMPRLVDEFAQLCREAAEHGTRIAFARSTAGDDPVNCLWVMDLPSGSERLVASPSELLAEAIESYLRPGREGRPCNGRTPRLRSHGH